MSNRERHYEFKSPHVRETPEERTIRLKRQKKKREEAKLAHRSLQAGSRIYRPSEVTDIFRSIAAPLPFASYAE